MGATDSTAICNIALRKLGQKKISDITDAGDVTAVKCNDIYSSLLKKLLIKAKPRFAVKSAVLGHVTDSTTDITNIAVSSGVITVTAAAHGLSTDDVVSIVDVAGMTKLNGQKFTVTVVDSNSVTLQNIDGSSYDDYVSGGTIGKVSDVEDEVDFDNRYNLPSDFLALWKLNGEPESQLKHSIEWGGSAVELLTDEVSANIKYIYSVTDTTKFDDLFVGLFAWLLAANLAFTITQSKSMAKETRGTYNIQLAEYKTMGSQSAGTPRQARQDDIIEARQ